MLAAADKLNAGQSAELSGLPGGGAHLLVFALLHLLEQPPVVIVPTLAWLDRLQEDLASLGWTSETPCLLPLDAPPTPTSPAAAARISARLRTLSAPGPWLASVDSVHQKTASPELLNASLFDLRPERELDIDRFMGRMVQAGFQRVRRVELPGEYAVRGGIIDVFSFGAEHPLRIELFGDEIDSLRAFDPNTQASIARLPHARCLLFDRQRFITSVSKLGVGPLSYLPDATLILLGEPSYSEAVGPLYQRFPISSLCTDDPFKDRTCARISPVPGGGELDFGWQPARAVWRDLQEAEAIVKNRADAGLQVRVLCKRPVECASLVEALEPAVEICLAPFSAGVELPERNLLLLTFDEVVGKHTRKRRAPKEELSGAPVEDFLELKPGDYLVHLAHGIGQFEALERITKAGRVQEFLQVVFANDTRIFVPVARLDLVQKYVGVGTHEPRLSRVGSRGWTSKKNAASRACMDLAAELLELAARRKARTGFTYQARDNWELEFAARFPFEETPDQLKAWDAIEGDMTQGAPMDRLICGDVGFGKTEIAIRAAFKAVMGGRQVAVLAPTTILSEQHLRTFRKRMEAYPVRVEVLNRFRSKKEQNIIIAGLGAGAVDIVIGTHRLLSGDLVFKNLGLLVVDEEQRFGVAHKEKIKKLRTNVEILTLSATPIPRTLHQSLIGLRDISNLSTPPPDRRDIESQVQSFDLSTIREAILRELARQGQVFFVHDRIQSLPALTRLLERIVPEARITSAHGKMKKRELEKHMMAFIRGKVDVLLSTSIVESGLDISRANTIIIDRADRFGLAELHQLRGRVGRGGRQAYAYFLVPSLKSLSPVSRRRLKAIEEFSKLGAGFSIAMRDLEIRGAGNLLGAQQSGHIANIGYELYCRLLADAQRALKAGGVAATLAVECEVEIDVAAHIPETQVPQPARRVAIYKKLAGLHAPEDLAAYSEELRDFLGRLPDAFENLFSLHELRVRLEAVGVRRVRLRENGLEFDVVDPSRLVMMLANFADRLQRPRDDRIILRFSTPPRPEDALRTLLFHLRRGADLAQAGP